MLWTILGGSVAILAAFCVAVAELLVGKSFFERYRFHIALLFVAAGIFAWFLGRYLARKDRLRLGIDERQRLVLFDLRYWGAMLPILGVIILFIQPLRHPEAQMPVPVSSPPKQPEITNAPAVVEKPAPVVFPPLKIQGVFLRNSTQSVAIISGECYSVGDHIGNATVKAIDRDSVIIELGGETKRFKLN